MEKEQNAMITVLVHDDDSEIRDVIHVYLRNEGYRVLEAGDYVIHYFVLGIKKAFSVFENPIRG